MNAAAVLVESVGHLEHAAAAHLRHPGADLVVAPATTGGAAVDCMLLADVLELWSTHAQWQLLWLNKEGAHMLISPASVIKIMVL